MILTRELVDRVYKIGNRRVSNYFDRQDIIQETLIVLSKATRDLSVGAVFHYCALLFYRTQKNPVLGTRKKGENRKVQVLTMLDTSLFDFFCTHTPEHALLEKERVEAVTKAIATLRRTMLQSATYYLEEGSIPGQAEFSSLRSSWVEAKKKLRILLKPFDFTPEDTYSGFVRLYDTA